MKKQKKHEFIDAQEAHREFPETFNVPEDSELKAIKIGDSVKVCYHGERFWTHVKEVINEDVTATVENVC